MDSNFTLHALFVTVQNPATLPCWACCVFWHALHSRIHTNICSVLVQ